MWKSLHLQHCLVCILSLPLVLGGMHDNDKNDIYELSTNLSSSDIRSQQPSLNEDIPDDTNGTSLSKCMGTDRPYQLNGHSDPSADNNVSILLFEGFSQEQWVGLDAVLLTTTMSQGQMRFVGTLGLMNVFMPTPLVRTMWMYAF